MVAKPLIVDRLDALRIVGHAKTGVRAAARIVVLQRQRLQARIEIGSQAQQGVQTHPDEQIIADESDETAEHADDHENDAEPEGDLLRRSRAEPMPDECACLFGAVRGIERQHSINDILERPRLERIYNNRCEGENHASKRRPKIRAKITECSGVDEHELPLLLQACMIFNGIARARAKP